MVCGAIGDGWGGWGRCSLLRRGCLLRTNDRARKASWHCADVCSIALAPQHSSCAATALLKVAGLCTRAASRGPGRHCEPHLACSSARRSCAAHRQGTYCLSISEPAMRRAVRCAVRRQRESASAAHRQQGAWLRAEKRGLQVELGKACARAQIAQEKSELSACVCLSEGCVSGE